MYSQQELEHRFKSRSLPERLLPVAERLAFDLRESRKNGTCSPEKPITSTRLIEIYRNRFGWKLNDSQIRDVVHHLRVAEELPIGSRRTKPPGYFWALNTEELKDTVLHMSSQEFYIREARLALMKMFQPKELFNG